MKEAYSSSTLPPLGKSDYINVDLNPLQYASGETSAYKHTDSEVMDGGGL